MFSTGTGNAAGQYFTPFRDKPAQYIGVLIIYLELLGTEFTDLLFKEDLTLSASTAPVITIPTVHGNIHTPIRPGRPLVFTILFIRHTLQLL
jgi:hypothetical protein